MVEKITITPQEVRGLGDIISPKTLSDFNKQYSTLTTTTDTVHGVTTTIYDLDSTILVFDAGTTNNHNDIWQTTNATISREDAYSLLTETTATGSCILNSSNKIPPSKTVELDLCQVDGGNTYAPLYIRNDGGGASLGSITYYILGATVGEWIHLRIVFSDSNTATVYSSTLNEPLALTLSNTSTNYRIMFNATGPITKIQFKNVVIY